MLASDAVTGGEQVDLVTPATNSAHEIVSPGAVSSPLTPPSEVGNRYSTSRRAFNDALRASTAEAGRTRLRTAMRSYVSKGAGGSRVLTRRMEAARNRVGSFYSALDTIQQYGKIAGLLRLNLDGYVNRPAQDILGALSDLIFQPDGKSFENTEDDYLVKEAYGNTVLRILREPDVSLDNLTSESVAAMTSIFICESIALRVLHDIGVHLYKSTTDVNRILRVEEDVYQLVEGLVRNTVMNHIASTPTTTKEDVERLMQSVYQIAFNSIEGVGE
ncbi:MAG: hypothetical protein JSS75_04065 [Bacteroidetes bacterium]|nr:hypothetical protein [Bacteroidota bacterium]